MLDVAVMSMVDRIFDLQDYREADYVLAFAGMSMYVLKSRAEVHFPHVEPAETIHAVVEPDLVVGYFRNPVPHIREIAMRSAQHPANCGCNVCRIAREGEHGPTCPCDECKLVTLMTLDVMTNQMIRTVVKKSVADEYEKIMKAVGQL